MAFQVQLSEPAKTREMLLAGSSSDSSSSSLVVPPLLALPVALPHPTHVDVPCRLHDPDRLLVRLVRLGIKRGDLALGASIRSYGN